MTKLRIDVLSPSFSRNKILVEELRNAFSDTQILFNYTGSEYLLEDISKRLSAADLAIVGKEPIDSRTLQGGRLQAIGKYGVGMDKISLSHCAKIGVEVLFEKGVNRLPVAEHTLGLIIGVLRNIAKNHTLMTQGTWVKDGGFGLAGKTVGILGFGNIGAELSRLIQPFHCEILYTDIVNRQKTADQFGAVRVDIDTLRQKSDILSIHTPLTAQTQSLVNSAFLAEMKDGSILINTARGEIVDIKALQKVFQNGKLLGAGLDVFETEPMIDGSLFETGHIIGTPHTAGNSKEAVLAMGRSAIQGLKKFHLNRS